MYHYMYGHELFKVDQTVIYYLQFTVIRASANNCSFSLLLCCLICFNNVFPDQRRERPRARLSAR